MPYEKICSNENCKKKFISPFKLQEYCSHHCFSLSHRKKERPSKEDMRHLIGNYTWVDIGKMFGISNVTAKRWADSYGLSHNIIYLDKSTVKDDRENKLTSNKMAKKYNLSISTVSKIIRIYGL